MGEPVSMAQHFCQAAHNATIHHGTPSEIAAALLHDIGHFYGEFGTYHPTDTSDKFHEKTGQELLNKYFPREIGEMVGLHVMAKRYLCAVSPEYYHNLSPASRHTLALQGGPCNAGEIKQFEQYKTHKSAVKIRIWDDKAKDPNAITPEFAHYIPLLQGLLL